MVLKFESLERNVKLHLDFSKFSKGGAETVGGVAEKTVYIVDGEMKAVESDPWKAIDEF